MKIHWHVKTISILLIILTLYACGGPKKQEYKQSELNIGSASKKIELDLLGNNLRSFINIKLLSDSSRNLISQLGAYKFSTSIDPENQDDNRNNPDAIIYYEYEGITLKYIFKGAGHYIDHKTGYVEQPNREQLQKTLNEFKNAYLEEILIEPRLYKGNLPFTLSSSSKPNDVIKVFGKQDSLFNSTSEKIRYKYPEKGVSFVFDYDSTMSYISLSDTLRK
ncbi:MAG: hypothetical protein Q8M29_12580 [Bacteroidota bacterium]|nr:hypothetical protein [Bacteroidota bacterium]